MKGWRKITVGGVIVLLTFGFVIFKTAQISNSVVVPDIPSNARDILLGIYFTFVAGNVGEHVSKRGQKPDA